jgi:hypothetical protein
MVQGGYLTSISVLPTAISPFFFPLFERYLCTARSERPSHRCLSSPLRAFPS